MSQEDARQILRASAAAVGRFQAPELFFTQDVNFAAPAAVNIPRPLNLNRPMESLWIVLAFRATVANNNMTSVAPEAPQNILQQVLLNGTHRQYGNLTPIRMSGATIFAWQRMFQATGNDLRINGTRAADPDIPFVSPFTGNVGTHDIVAVYNVPCGPLMGIGQSTKRDLASYLYQPADWGDTLQLQLNFGDESALGVPNAAGDVTFTAFGSAAGLPNLSIHLNYSILGPFANSLKTGVVIRQEQNFAQFVTAAQQQRIMQLQKQITTNVVVKTGTTQAATAGVNTFATLTDLMLQRTQIMVDNKPVKNNQNNLNMKAYVGGRMFNTVLPEGYFNLTFVDGQNPQLAYRGDGLAGGSLYELFSDIATTGATQQLNVTQEMIYGGPFPPLRPA